MKYNDEGYVCGVETGDRVELLTGDMEMPVVAEVLEHSERTGLVWFEVEGIRNPDVLVGFDEVAQVAYGRYEVLCDVSAVMGPA